MLLFTSRSVAAPEAEPRRRIKKGNNDPVLVVKEAARVGDARFQAKCLDRIKQMKESGVSILFVSHDIAAVRTLCDRALWLDKGTVRGLGDVFPITAQYTEHLFNGAPNAGNQPSRVSSDTGPHKLSQPINHC